MIKEYLKQLQQNGNSLLEYMDIIWCAIRYGASPNNYRDFGFSKLSAKERKTYVTNGLSRKLIRNLNDPSYIELFENKIKFANKFAEYFKRNWISTKDITYADFLQFIEGKEKIIYKPIGAAQGKGIIVYDNLNNAKIVFDAIVNQNVDAILEEWIEQHETLSAVYNEAINCLRIITVYKNGEHLFLQGGVTWGNGEKIANASASGIVSPIDFENGILEKPAADFSGTVYKTHPISGVNLVGLQLPFWNETIEMLKKAMEEIPEVAYIGWDVAITPDGPLIIEGNTTPGYRYYQIPVHMTEKTGNRERYEYCLK